MEMGKLLHRRSRKCDDAKVRSSRIPLSEESVSVSEAKYDTSKKELEWDEIPQNRDCVMNRVSAVYLALITKKSKLRPRKSTCFVEAWRHRDLKSALASPPLKINVSPMPKE